MRRPVVDASESTRREAKIADLKRQIERRTYETPEKMEAALDAFLDDYVRGAVQPGEDRPPQPSRPK